MRRSVVVALYLALAIAAPSCSSNDPAGPDGPGLRVLFLGNSLTYSNDLPLMVEALADASGINIETESITEANFALEDHWNYGNARERVREGNFDVVIMQQGPSSLPENRIFLREWTATWNTEIRAGGATPGLYAVWPDLTRMFAFSDVSDSYRLAAEDVNGYFFPVGDTWIETWAANPDAPLYSGDGFHPSYTGTYAAAVVILAVLAQRDPTSLSGPVNVPGVIGDPISQSVALQIRVAARSVIARFGGQVRPH